MPAAVPMMDSMTPFVRFMLRLAAVCVVVVALGLVLAQAFYYDDQCPESAFVCGLGDVGLSMFVYGLYALPFIAAAGLIAFAISALTRD